MKLQRLHHGWGLLLVLWSLGPDASPWADVSVEHQRRLEAHYGLERPEGRGPFPAVMLVSGCSGFAAPLAKDRYARVAKRLKDQGFVVLKVDYLAARGISMCGAVLHEEVAQDIASAARYLRAQSFVKTTAINVVGWSYGGGGALVALSKVPNRSPVPVDAVVVYFPDCRFALPWEGNVPVLVLFGAKDDIVPVQLCERLIARVPARARVKFLVYPDAHHGFDNADLPAEMPYAFGTLGYNEKAAKAAWKEVERFLRR